jgi:hypothetical protein
MTTKLSNTDLVITVVQAAIDVFWRHWDGSAETTRTAREASEFWTMQAFGAHGDWVRTAINGALHVFLRAYLTDSCQVAQSEDHAVATVVYKLTGRRVVVG